METSEKILFSNTFGSISEKSLKLYYKRGTEEIPIKQFTSVSFQHSRNYFFAILGFVIAMIGVISIIININNINGIAVLIILVFIILGLLTGIANWIGHHNINISVNGKDRKPLKVEMSKTSEGLAFINSVKKVVIK